MFSSGAEGLRFVPEQRVLARTAIFGAQAAGALQEQLPSLPLACATRGPLLLLYHSVRDGVGFLPSGNFWYISSGFGLARKLPSDGVL
jgi:hypothetical protein